MVVHAALALSKAPGGDREGEMPLLAGGERAATVVAETELLCLRLSGPPAGSGPGRPRLKR